MVELWELNTRENVGFILQVFKLGLSLKTYSHMKLERIFPNDHPLLLLSSIRAVSVLRAGAESCPSFPVPSPLPRTLLGPNKYVLIGLI